MSVTTFTEQKQQRQLLKQRAETAGLLSGEVFRQRLGLDYTAFVAAMSDGRVPPPLVERSGSKYWLAETVDAVATKMKR